MQSIHQPENPDDEDRVDRAVKGTAGENGCQKNNRGKLSEKGQRDREVAKGAVDQVKEKELPKRGQISRRKTVGRTAREEVISRKSILKKDPHEKFKLNKKQAVRRATRTP